MKASKFTDAQKAFIIRQGEDGTPVEEICRKAGISQATYFNWKKKYSGMMPSEMRRLRELEDENNRLKRIVADLSLASASWWTRCALAGRCRCAEHAGFFASIRRATAIVLVAPVRPRSKIASARFARRACAMAIGASTSCSGAKAGQSTRRGRAVSTTRLACNCATRRLSVAC
jgi:putative transposase